MKLLIDLGNTRCKFALMQQDGTMEYDVQDYSSFGKLYSVKTLCDKFSDVEKVIICSVLSEKMNEDIFSRLVDQDGHDVFFISPSENSFGIQLIYEDLSTIGADRVTTLISAHDKYLGKSCIIDCGTAVTVDTVDEKGLHLGGVILPGLISMQNILLSNTKIKAKQINEEYNMHATSTETAIHTGCMSAVVGGIEYVVNKMQSNYGPFQQIVLTGGDVDRLYKHFSHSFLSLPLLRDNNLVLDGLKVIADKL